MRLWTDGRSSHARFAKRPSSDACGWWFRCVSGAGANAVGDEDEDV